MSDHHTEPYFYRTSFSVVHDDIQMTPIDYANDPYVPQWAYIVIDGYKNVWLRTRSHGEAVRLSQMLNYLTHTAKRMELAIANLQSNSDSLVIRHESLKLKCRQMQEVGDHLFDRADDGSDGFLTVADDWNEACGLGRPHNTKRDFPSQ